jgi:hypothetical protein
MSERRHGQWAGNPKGNPEDPTRCIEEVRDAGRWPTFHQCYRKRAIGDYCVQHARKHGVDCVECRQSPAASGGLCEGCIAYKEHQR